ncbi:MAG: transposase InsO family protein [Crocinitomicaceae bacterium]|jgi:transposase InsO family protein
MSRKEEKALLLKDWDNAVAESFFKSLKTEWVYKITMMFILTLKSQFSSG